MYLLLQNQIVQYKVELINANEMRERLEYQVQTEVADVRQSYEGELDRTIQRIEELMVIILFFEHAKFVTDLCCL
jgi:sensor domain CHASE-containing protein